MPFDILTARKLGYSDDEIKEYLNKYIDVEKAIKKRFSLEEISAHVSKSASFPVGPAHTPPQQVRDERIIQPEQFAPPSSVEVSPEYADIEGIKTTPPWERVPKGFGMGVAGMVGATGGVASYIGEKASPGDKKNILKDIGKNISEYGKVMEGEYTIPDPDFIYNLSGAVASSGAFLIPGLGVQAGVAKLALAAPKIAALAGLTGIAVSSVLESGVQLGAMYNDLIEKGESKEKAKKAAEASFAANMVLLMVSNKAGGLFDRLGTPAKRFLAAGLSEGFQESGQEIIDNIIKEDPVLKNTWESFVMGFLVHGGTAATQIASEKIEQIKKGSLTDVAKETIGEIIEPAPDVTGEVAPQEPTQMEPVVKPLVQPAPEQTPISPTEQEQVEPVIQPEQVPSEPIEQEFNTEEAFAEIEKEREVARQKEEQEKEEYLKVLEKQEIEYREDMDREEKAKSVAGELKKAKFLNDFYSNFYEKHIKNRGKTAKEQWQKLTGKKLTAKYGELIKLSPEIEGVLDGMVADFNTTEGKEFLEENGMEVPEHRDDIVEWLSSYIGKKQIGALEKQLSELSKPRLNRPELSKGPITPGPETTTKQTVLPGLPEKPAIKPLPPKKKTKRSRAKQKIEKTTGIKKQYDFVTGKYEVKTLADKVVELKKRFKSLKNETALNERGIAEVALDVIRAEKLEGISKTRKEMTEAEKKLTDTKGLMFKKMRELVSNYARSVGYKGIMAPKYYESMKTVKGVENALEKIDKHVEKRLTSSTARKTRKEINRVKKTIGKIESGKLKSPWPEESVSRLKEYVKWLDEDTGPMDINKILDEKGNVKPNASEEEKRFARIYKHVYSQSEETFDNALDIEDKIFFTNALRPKLGNMSNSQLEEVLGDIRSIKETGKTVRDKEIARMKKANQARIAITVQQILSTIEGKKEPGLLSEEILENTKKQRKTAKAVQLITKIAKKFGWENLRPELISELFTERFTLLGMKPGGITKYVFDKLTDANNKELIGIARHKEKVKGIVEVVNKALEKNAEIDISVPAGDGERKVLSFPLNSAMFVYAHSKNDDSIRHLIGSGLDEQTIKEVDEKLPEEVKDAVDGLIKFYDTVIYPKLNAVFKKAYGVSMPKVIGYFPIMRLFRANAESAIIADLFKRYSENIAKIDTDSIKLRVGAKNPFKDFDFLKTIYQHMKHVEHYIAYEENVEDIRGFINDKDLRDAMKLKSEEATSTYIKYIKDATLGNPPLPKKALDLTVDFLRRNFSVWALGLPNIRPAIKQIASIFQGAAFSTARGDVGKSVVKKNLLVYGETLKHALRYPFHMEEMKSFARDNSVMMKNRPQQMERYIEDLYQDKEFEKLSGFGGKVSEAFEYSMKLIQELDIATTTTLWIKEYEAVFSKTLSEEAAKKSADMLIRRTQPMSGYTNLPEVFRDRGVLGSFMMFKNQQNQNANLAIMLAAAKASKSAPKGDVDEKAMKFFAAMIMQSLFMYAANNGISAMFRSFRDDPETLAAYSINAMTGGFQLVGDVMNTMMEQAVNAIREGTGRKRKWTKQYEPSPAPFQIVSDLTMLSGAVLGGDWDKATEQAMNTASQFVRAPRELYKIGEKTVKGELFKGRDVDYSVEKAMRDRIEKSKDIKERAVFLKWYTGLSEGKKKDFKSTVPEFSKKILKYQKSAEFFMSTYGNRIQEIQKDFHKGEITEKQRDEKLDRLKKNREIVTGKILPLVTKAR